MRHRRRSWWRVSEAGHIICNSRQSELFITIGTDLWLRPRPILLLVVIGMEPPLEGDVLPSGIYLLVLLNASRSHVQLVLHPATQCESRLRCRWDLYAGVEASGCHVKALQTGVLRHHWLVVTNGRFVWRCLPWEVCLSRQRRSTAQIGVLFHLCKICGNPVINHVPVWRVGALACLGQTLSARSFDLRLNQRCNFDEARLNCKVGIITYLFLGSINQILLYRLKILGSLLLVK